MLLKQEMLARGSIWEEKSFVFSDSVVDRWLGWISLWQQLQRPDRIRLKLFNHPDRKTFCSRHHYSSAGPIDSGITISSASSSSAAVAVIAQQVESKINNNLHANAQGHEFNDS
ncbi:uncharacterized protein LOC120419403 [Culex pipiens pallens]|uniref:uncharacterized protein LOC120419403 n=1 Tax=Culex pipiens pallens TaxID=42434 RepID=UPI00195371F6|nr:uncharacterized protein LOC120419403 [Culex pipiens pallens]